MNLVKQTWSMARWTASLLKAFFRVRPTTTLTVLCMAAISRAVQVLTFFLPLKVIILAGSEGVPRYFQYLPIEGAKEEWIVWLAAAAVVMYALSLLLERMIERLSDSASRTVLEGAAEMAIVGQHRDAARTYYARATEAIGGGLFAAVGFAAIAVLNLQLLAAVLLVALLAYLIAVLGLIRGDQHSPGRFRRWLTDGLRSYLDVVSSVMFLVGFLVLLMPFVLGMEANIMFAILCVFILRRILGSLERSVDLLVGLYKDRVRVDPLVFRRRHVQQQETADSRTVRELFAVEAREQLAARKFDEILEDSEFQHARWMDSRISGAFTFHIAARAKDGSLRVGQLQAFPPRQAHALEAEEFLFSAVSRDALHAPAVLVRFREGPFECQICDYGTGKAPSPGTWQEQLPDLVADYWRVAPPKHLLKAYNATHPLLHERLTDELVSRLEVAVDTGTDREVYTVLQNTMPHIRERLAAMPLHVFNPDFERGTVGETEDGRLQIMTWTRWAIEPVGVYVPNGFAEQMLDKTLARFNAGRKQSLAPADIGFAANCWQLERAIKGMRYKVALELAGRIMSESES